jgi:hypothetical protein
MVRGVTGLARGGRRAAAVDEIEVKAGLPERAVKRALKRWKLDRDDGSPRRLHYFDTPQQDLLAAGIVARARRIRGGEHDSTVKLRPVTPAAIGEQWRAFRGFKVETDASERELDAAASFSMPIARGVIRRIARGRGPVGDGVRIGGLADRCCGHVRFLRRGIGLESDQSEQRICPGHLGSISFR